MTTPARSADEEAAPLPSDEDDAEITEEESEEESDEEPAKPVRPPAPAFRFSTFILVFLFILGIWMIFDNSTRNSVASVFGYALNPLIGFGGHYLLLTMFLAAVIEMFLTAVAYNWATDWVKVARVQAWSAAFRPLQMRAIRSGKKDRIEAIKPHQQQLTKLSSEVSMAQLKGMAVTWFLVIAIYTWVGLFLAAQASAVVNLGGASVSLMSPLTSFHIPLWFLLFSVYTVPMSLLFRRFLKHYKLRKYSTSRPPLMLEVGGAGGLA